LGEKKIRPSIQVMAVLLVKRSAIGREPQQDQAEKGMNSGRRRGKTDTDITPSVALYYSDLKNAADVAITMPSRMINAVAPNARVPA
jgi:hypothetical protein